MRFAYLGSGSQGNGLVVEADGSRLLLDCAHAAGQPQAARDVLRHLRVYHQRDVRLKAALAAPAPTPAPVPER